MALTYSNEIPSEKGTTDKLFAKDKEIKVSSSSIFSTDTNVTLVDEESFQAGTRLLVHARGRNLIRLPLPSSELEITVADLNGNPVYTSTRQKRCSGDAILSHIKLGDVISISYFFGPNRDPLIRMLQPVDVSLDMVKIQSKWTTRATRFTLPNGKTFEWFYNSKNDPESHRGTHTNVLVLRSIGSDPVEPKKVEKGRSKAIAKLIRSDETRTPGSSRSTAGNGGELVFDIQALEYLDESIVVATCLMMLKREVDRRRALQFAVMAGAAGGN